jgi:DHA1 family bicyclomycin/chloramphenicol resistance-like MFS transporter
MTAPARPVPVLTLAATCALSQMALTIYLPSVPDMIASMAVDRAAVQMVLTVYLVSFTAALPFVGPISDRVGRKPVLVSGLVLFFLGSLGCSLAPPIELLWASRILQAVGGCCGVVVARAVVRDMAVGTAGARALAYTSVGMSMASIFSPTIGSQVHTLLDWQGNFYILAGFAAVILLFGMPRLKESRRPGAVSGNILRSYGALLRHKRFRDCVIAIGFTSGTFYSFLAAAPSVFMEGLGMSVQAFAIVPMLWGLGFTTGGLASTRLIAYFPPTRLILLGITMTVVSGLGMSGMTLLGIRDPYLLLIPVFLFGLGNALNIPQGMNLALTTAPAEIAGAASSMIMLSQFVVGSAGSFLMAALPVGTPVPVALVVTASALVSLAFYLRVGLWKVLPA